MKNIRLYIKDIVYGANDGIITTFAVEMLAVGGLAALIAFLVGQFISTIV